TPSDRLAHDVAIRCTPIDVGGNLICERAAPRDENRPRVRIVLGLRDQIGGNPVRPSTACDDDDLGWAGVEVDGAVARDESFCGGHVTVAGPDDLVDP